METNLIYLLNSGNILNMFEIQKCWKNMSERRVLNSKIHCLTLNLLCATVSRTIFFFGLFLP